MEARRRSSAGTAGAGTQRLDSPVIDVRPPLTGEGRAIARVHIRSWQAGYRGIFPDRFLDDLDGEFDAHAARWEDIMAEDVPAGRLLVATLGGVIEGWASFGPAGAHMDHGDSSTVPGAGLGEIYGFYVHPDSWRRGVGRVLMDAAIGALAAAGYGEAVLWVLEDNPRARGFYETAGWRFDGGRSLFAHGEATAPEVRYRRDL